MKLKLLVLFTIVAFGANTLVAQDQKKNEKKGEITFTTTTHDFGTVKEDGGNISHTFKFKNTGDAPVILTNVSASCGCTSPEWTKDPVLPGKEGSIVVTYFPNGRPGSFQKTVTVMSNAKESVVVLTIKGDVTPKVASSEVK